jgi:hypothetical protein
MGHNLASTDGNRTFQSTLFSPPKIGQVNFLISFHRTLTLIVTTKISFSLIIWSHLRYRKNDKPWHYYK